MKPTQDTPTHQGLSNGSKSVTRDAMTFQWYQEGNKRCYGFPMTPRAGQETLWLGRSQSNKQNKQTTFFHR
jgi:hypothetical protein